jgi:hypothetical protein
MIGALRQCLSTVPGLSYRRFGVDVSAILILAAFVSRTPAMSQRCWPVKDVEFAPGTQDQVATRAADFLIRVEDVPPHPYWPGGASGVTLGAGWDAGHHSAAELRETWAALGADALSHLEPAAGRKGLDAKALIPALRSIDIPRDVSIHVLVRSLKDYYCPFVDQLFPGLDRLPADVQVVFISVVFNRGAAMGHDPDWRTAKEVDQRWEMRRMRDDVRRADMFAIYAHLGTMKRLWETSGPRGLPIRRRDEQSLIRPYVNQQLRWEENRDKLKKAGAPPCPN